MGCRISVLSLDEEILSLLQNLKVSCSISTKHRDIYRPPALCFPIHFLLLLKLGCQSCTRTLGIDTWSMAAGKSAAPGQISAAECNEDHES